MFSPPGIRGEKESSDLEYSSALALLLDVCREVQLHCERRVLPQPFDKLDLNGGCGFGVSVWGS